MLGLGLLAQQAIWHVVQVHPLLGLRIPSSTGGDDVQMGIVLAIAAMGLDNHDAAALEGAATDSAKDIIQTADATAHERTQYRFRLLIKLTFRALFRTSEAILEESPVEGGAGAIYRLFHAL